MIETELIVGDSAVHRRMVENAIQLSADTTATLILFLREGAVCNWPFGDAEPVTWLANALNIVCEIERRALLCQPSANDYSEELKQLLAATHKFMEKLGQAPSLDVDNAVGGERSQEPSISDDDLPF